MQKLGKYNVKEALGFTRIADIQDREIWNHLLTPQVKALLGPITRFGEAEIMETIHGRFPGDEVCNLNKHQLYAGSTEYVRFPYVSTMHKTEHGALVIKRDAVKTKALCWVGDVMSGKAELAFMGALRDRRYDGKKRSNDSALVNYEYDDERLNSPLHATLKAAEVSVYSFTPGSRVLDCTGDPLYEEFIQHPFSFLNRPELFAHLFNRVWKTKRGPGQIAHPIQDVSKYCLAGVEKVARSKGYDFIEACPSHYHVAMWFKSRGYRFRYQADATEMARLEQGIKQIKESGRALTRPQESWVCVVQSLRPLELIPEGLYLNGPIWMQDNIGQKNLWVNKPLNDRAANAIPGPLP